MLAQAYHELKDRQRKEFNEFPMAFAFSNEQLDQAMLKLHATPDQCCTVLGMGDIVRKENAPKLRNMIKRHNDEIYIFLTNDKNDAYEAFRYEMENHEYAINWDGDDDVLGCFGLTYDKLVEFGLKDVYERARRDYMKDAVENEWF